MPTCSRRPLASHRTISLFVSVATKAQAGKQSPPVLVYTRATLKKLLLTKGPAGKMNGNIEQYARLGCIIVLRGMHAVNLR